MDGNCEEYSSSMTSMNNLCFPLSYGNFPEGIGRSSEKNGITSCDSDNSSWSSCGRNLYDFDNPNHNHPSLTIDEGYGSSGNVNKISCSQYGDKEGKGRGKAKTVYEANAKRRTKFAKLRVNRIKDDILGFETVTGGKAYATISYLDGRGKKIKQEFGSKNNFLKNNQGNILQNSDSIVNLMMGVIQTKLGAALTSKFKLNSAGGPNDMVQEKFLLDKKNEGRWTIGRDGICSVCGNKELVVEGELSDPIALWCSHGEGLNACPRSVHLYCLGILPKSDSIPPFYCLDHRKEAFKTQNLSQLN